MPTADDLIAIEALVRERMRAALNDKTAYERDGQRLNSQLMQGELNMGSAVLAWIEQRRGGATPEPDDDTEEPD
jgi:hypothetical protein